MPTVSGCLTESLQTDQILPEFPTWSSVSDDCSTALFCVLSSKCNGISICRIEPAIQKVCEPIRAVKVGHCSQKWCCIPDNLNISDLLQEKYSEKMKKKKK